MRNRLIHGYFDVDYSVVWEVAQKQLPVLSAHFDLAICATSPPIHPWRVCGYGCSDVRFHDKEVEVSAKNPDGKTAVTRHCRKNKSGKDQLYPKEMRLVFEAALKSSVSLPTISALPLKEYPHGNDFDRVIQVWTKYWNDIFSPIEVLSPNIVKALLFSESSFRSNIPNTRISKSNFARGLFQISDQTRKILADEKGEIRDHFLTLTADEVRDPGMGVAAAIRWLFYKRDRATAYLGRLATWKEAVAEYKSYLKRKGKHKGQEIFERVLAELIGASHK